ncbi:GNAT family N-acetyltransferase [Streptomyces sp. NBC_01754]|uniref:GNAT family N-acetyltransferase n=1 Tax=Streptomyces sp. NBC_01754 TaxID=2975930 RepID=UPI002DDA74FA|nr:GNAT family N-acetyltransferase [Streptomyces sp. NBC_01754]WSC94055.1 GNAT family N-acetyltransferase [Streptomyces sp. NBC_01754]
MARIRVMGEADIDAVAALRVRGWRSAYAGIIPQDFLDRMSAERDAQRHRARFASSRGKTVDLVSVGEDDTPVGWICCGPYRGETDSGDVGEVYALYVEPTRMGTGLGRALLDAAHRHESARGFATWQLWVLQDNARARKFYAAAGYAADGAVESDVYGDTAVAEVRYRRPAP